MTMGDRIQQQAEKEEGNAEVEGVPGAVSEEESLQARKALDDIEPAPSPEHD